MPYYHAAYAVCNSGKKTGVRTMEVDMPFHAVLELLKVLGTDYANCMKMRVVVFEFADGDIYHDGFYPGEEKKLVDSMNCRRREGCTVFEVEICGSVTITASASGREFGFGRQKSAATTAIPGTE